MVVNSLVVAILTDVICIGFPEFCVDVTIKAFYSQILL